MSLAETSYDRRGEVLVVALAGEVDLSNVGALEDEVLAKLDGAGTLIVDLDAVEYLDSAGLAMIDRLTRRSAPSTSVMLVAATTAVVRRTLEVSGFDQLMPVHPTLAEATAAAAR